MLIGVDASRITRPVLTGTENYSLHVLRWLLRLDQADRFRLYLSQSLPSGLLPEAATAEQRVISLPRLWTHLGLGGEMALRPPDVLFVPSHVLPLITPGRSVVVVYDVGHRFFPRAHKITEWLYVEWAIRRHVRVASAIITISEAARQDLVRLYGADPARISVAYPAVDERFRPPSEAEVQRVREKYGLGSRYVLHVSTIKPRKNLPRLVQAFARANLAPGTQLVLAGAPDFGLAALNAAIEQTGTGDRVKWLRYVDGADLPALYGGAACVALVSLHEGFGIPALEALACGAPLVASNRSSIPEFVDNAGLLVDPLDVTSIQRGLEQACTDQVLADTLRQRGPLQAARYTWQAAATVTLDVLRRVGGQPAGRTPPGPPRPSAAS